MEINLVKIENNKIVATYWSEDLEIWQNSDIRLLNLSIGDIMRNSVEFSDDLTIEGFMLAIEPYLNDIYKIFNSSLSGYKLDSFYNQMKKDKTEELNDINYIEFYRYSEIYDGYVDEYCSYHGISNSENLQYSLSMSPINNWKHLIFKLNENFVISTYDKKEKKLINLVETKKKYSLYEVLDNFLYEITFFGDVDDIEETAKELDKLISENIECENTYTLDEVKLKFLKKELDILIKNENYEDAAIIQTEINELECLINKNK